MLRLISIQYGAQIASFANEPNIPCISAFASANTCSSPACKAVLQSSLEGTTNLLRQLEDITQNHQKNERQTQLHLDALTTLEDAYEKFNRPLADDDIREISEKTDESPRKHGGGSGAPRVDESDYTDLSSTGL